MHSININLSKNLGLVGPGMVITQLGVLRGAFPFPAKPANYSAPEQEIRGSAVNVHTVFWGPTQVALFYATSLTAPSFLWTGWTIGSIVSFWPPLFIRDIIHMFPVKQNKHFTYLWVGRKRHRVRKQKYLQNISGDYFCICSACLWRRKERQSFVV